MIIKGNVRAKAAQWKPEIKGPKVRITKAANKQA